MPRNEIVISGFQNGIVSTPDAQDIPENAASYSVDIDPRAESGKLRPRFDDQRHNPAKTRATGAKHSGFIQTDSDRWDLVYHDEVNDAVKIQQTFVVSVPQSPVTLFSVEDGEDIQIKEFTRSVRVSRSADEPVQWVGYCEDDQLNLTGDLTTVVQEDAQLITPSGDPFYDKLVWQSDTNVYAFSRGDNRLYKLDPTNQTSTEVLFDTFFDLRAIGGSYNDPTKLWVIDNDSGTLYLVCVDMTTDAVVPIDGYDRREINLPSCEAKSWGVVTDCEAINSVTYSGNDQVFFSHHHGTATEASTAPSNSNQYWLASIEDNEGTQVLTVTDRTPGLNKIVYNDVTTGVGGVGWNDTGVKYSLGGIVSLFNSSAPEADYAMALYETFPIALRRLGANRIGWVYRALPHIEGWGPYFVTSNASPNSMKYVPCGGLMMRIVAGNFKPSDSVNPNYSAARCAMLLLDWTAANDMDFGGISYYDSSPSYFAYSNRKNIVRFQEGNYYITTGHTVKTATIQDLFTGANATFKNTTADVLINMGPIWSTNRYLLSPQQGASGLLDLPYNFDTGDDLTEIMSTGNLSVEFTHTAGGGEFTALRDVFYRFSFEYDGYQESPMSRRVYVDPRDTGETFNSTVAMILTAKNLPRRITGINMYRATAEHNASEVDEFYRYVTTFKLVGSVFVSNLDGTYTHRFLDDNTKTGATYEARTGISETVDNSFVDYALSTVLDGQLFVARCRKDELKDAKFMIFKSKSLRYDMFNWIDEYLRLPEMPVALTSYNGRLYAFSSRNIYRINPDGLYIEDILPGAGALGFRSVCTTEIGIFFCNLDHLLLTDGQSLAYIGESVRLSESGVGWADVDHAYFNPIVLYSPELQQVHFIVDSQFSHADFANNTAVSFCYHLPSKRWDLWRMPTYDTTPESYGAFIYKNGELMYSNGYGVYSIAGSTSRKSSWAWRSAHFHLGDSTQRKKWYHVKTNGTLAASTAYTIIERNFGSPLPLQDYDADSQENEIDTDHRIAKELCVLIEGGLGTDHLNALSVIGRPMVGLR